MAAESKPKTWRQRFTERWPMLAFHARVLLRMGTVEVTHRIASWVSVLIIFGVGVALLFNQELFKLADSAARGFDPRLPIIAWAVVIVIAFMRANYAEIQERESKIAQLNETLQNKDQERNKALLKDMRRDFRKYAHDAVLDAVKKATDELFVPLRDDPNPYEVRWTAEIAAWDDANVEMLKLWWTEADGAYYTQAAELVTEIGDWRTRLLTHLNVRTDRLLEIAKRKGKYADD